MTKPEPPDLRRLGKRLKAAKASERSAPSRQTDQGMGIGLRIAVELLSAVVVGTLIGLGLDRWLGTRPWLLILFFLLGSMAGFLNVIRVSRRIDAEHGKGKTKPEVKGHPEN
ncbi:MAG: AtpZ/AtpI family protein [Alphaproteobacteria bacterium]